MKIEFIKDYKCFAKDRSFHLNEFTVLTGENGSGKTNLLHAILGEDIVLINDVSRKSLNVVYYDYNSFNSTPNVQREPIQSSVDLYLNTLWIEFQNFAKGYNVNEHYIQKFERIAVASDKSLNELTEFDFKSNPIDRSNEGLMMFTYQFFKDSGVYLSAIEQNKYNSYRNESYGERNLVFSKEEFSSRYGEPPWQILNDILEKTSMNYRFYLPKSFNRNSFFELKFIDIENEVEVYIDQMSSGEKTILKVVASLYELEVIDNLPDILLFDEIDALLHPSLSKKVVSVLHDYIVQKKNKKVILVTHSPSTVAVAPEESIYLCERAGFEVRKVSKDEAINNLIQGVHSLSIHHENRRQVFLEDKDDSYFYEAIYKRIQEFLFPNISLNFIPISRVDKNNSGGKSNVKAIVNTLSRYGNKQVFGIIDYDNVNDSNGAIRVVKTRHSIENYIYDPVFLIALLLFEKVVEESQLKLNDGFKYYELKSLSNNSLQTAVDCLIELFNYSELKEEKVIIDYINGKTITIPKWYCEIKGHELEKKIFKIFPKTISIQQMRKSLKRYIIDYFIEELPGFIPHEFVSLFQEIQKR